MYVELRTCHLSKALVPAVITVDGKVDEMFFSQSMQLTASADDTSKDGLQVKAICKWFNLKFLSKTFKVAVTEFDSPHHDVVLTHD